MTDVTRILSAIEQGDPHAASQLLPLIYDELRKLAATRLAQEKPGQTLDATALVHEAYVRLAAKSPRNAELVKLRYFLGCTMAEAAQVLDIAPATAEEDWTYAKAWLRRQWLHGEGKNAPD